MMTSTRTADVPAGRTLRARRDAVLDALGRVPLSIIQVLFRVGVASVFLKAGLTKIASWPVTVQLFQDEYRVPVFSPEVAAALATAFELGCSTLLILGLATRVATLPLLGMLFVIQTFVYPGAWSEHLVWGSILLFLLTRGGGRLSLDRAFGIERDGRAE